MTSTPSASPRRVGRRSAQSAPASRARLARSSADRRAVFSISTTRPAAPRGPRGTAARARCRASPRARSRDRPGSASRRGRRARPARARGGGAREEPDEVGGGVDGPAVDQLQRAHPDGRPCRLACHAPPILGTWIGGASRTGSTSRASASSRGPGRRSSTARSGRRWRTGGSTTSRSRAGRSRSRTKPRRRVGPGVPHPQERGRRPAMDRGGQGRAGAAGTRGTRSSPGRDRLADRADALPKGPRAAGRGDQRHHRTPQRGGADGPPAPPPAAPRR